VTLTKECLLWLLSVRKEKGRKKNTNDLSKEARAGNVDQGN
jgi:hypothetical protein